MADTYTQVCLHIVIVVEYRESLILNNFKDELEKYITGIVKNKGHKLIAINSMPDHMHIFVGLNPDDKISDLVRNLKRDSTNFINEKNIVDISSSGRKDMGLLVIRIVR